MYPKKLRVSQLATLFFASQLILFLPGCASLSEEQPDQVDLTGIWRLDPSQSESPNPPQQDADGGGSGRAASGMPPRGGGRRGPGPGAREGAMEGGMEGGMPGGMPGGMNRDHLTAEELDIEQRAGSTRIEYDLKTLEVYYWGHEQASTGNVKSGWRETSFVLQYPSRRNSGLERIFSLDESGKQLSILNQMGDNGWKQVYLLDEEATHSLYPEGM